MVELLQKPAEFPYPKAPEPARNDQGAIPTGSRNQILISLAGTMRRRGMSEEAIYNALLTENKKRCVPSLPESEVSAIAKSVTRYEPTAPIATANRSRLQAETAFIKAIYEYPINYPDFAWVKTGMFSDRAYQIFWAAMEKEQNTTRAAIEAGILEQLSSAIEYDPNRIDEYANQLVKFGYMETLVKAAREVQKAAENGQVEKASQIIQGMANESVPTANCEIQSVDDGLDSLEKMMTGGQAVIKTGVSPIDRITGGLPINSLSILAARPGVGKTSMTWQIARTAAMGGEKVLYVSLEMKSWELWLKAACGLAEVRPVDIIGDDSEFTGKRQQIRDEIMPELRRTYGGKIDIFDDSSAADTSVIWRVAQMSAARLVIVDHLNLVTNAGESQNLRLDVISRTLKAMAKKLNVHVLLIHQLNRALEKRDDKRPQLSDLRESGHIEENADQVFFLHRPDYWDVEETKCRYSETMFIVGKGRLSGAGNTAGMIYDLSQQWFYRKDEVPSGYRSVKQVIPGNTSFNDPTPHWSGDD
jgi:replicative DNA helicase